MQDKSARLLRYCHQKISFCHLQLTPDDSTRHKGESGGPPEFPNALFCKEKVTKSADFQKDAAETPHPFLRGTIPCRRLPAVLPEPTIRAPADWERIPPENDGAAPYWRLFYFRRATVDYSIKTEPCSSERWAIASANGALLHQATAERSEERSIPSTELPLVPQQNGVSSADWLKFPPANGN